MVDTITARRKTCAFCGSTPLTREHLWPKWGRDLVESRPVRHHRTAELEFREVENHEFPLPPFDLTVKAVCGACNNGWMSSLEERAKPLLMPGLRGHGKQLAAGGQATLAAWALKTALVFGLTRQVPRPMPDEHYRHLLAHQRPPEECIIWMGAYDGPTAGFLQAAGMAIGARGEVLDASSRPNLYVATLTFGPILFQVLGTADCKALDVRTISCGDPRLRVIWPVGDTFTWSPRRALGPSELQRYADAIYDRLNDALSAGEARWVAGVGSGGAATTAQST